MKLKNIGFNHKVKSAIKTLKLSSSARLGRVFQDAYHIYRLLDGEGEVRAVLSGRLKHLAETKSALPVVGDWVFFDESRGKARIVELVPRYSRLSRKVVGDVTNEQVLVANVDTVFLVTAPDNDFNPRRIERFLTLAKSGGIRPVILLNKSDLVKDVSVFIDKIRDVASDVSVYTVSVLNESGLEVLHEYLQEGQTFALVGSSGVGKSSIINALLGREVLEIGDVHKATSQGRHTTTRREMFFTPSGALLIDTPGLRELQIWAESDSVEYTFSDIERLSEKCRFRNCHHENEPGCAVREAVEAGELESERLASYLKQKKEAELLTFKKTELQRKRELQKSRKNRKSVYFKKNKKLSSRILLNNVD